LLNQSMVADAIRSSFKQPQDYLVPGHATKVVVNNPFAPHLADVELVDPAALIKDLCPEGPFPYACRWGGEWILRADWNRPVGAKVVEFFAVTQGGGQGGSDVGRVVLMIAAVYLATQFGPLVLGSQLGTALAVFAATSLVNLLVPVRSADSVTGSGSSNASNTYNASLSGNQFRLEEPIPVLYGRNKTFPNFAAEPYNEYDTNDDQYYNALFCLGQGEYEIEAILIDDTKIDNFRDVLVRRVLPPGTLPSTVSSVVVNSPEVSGAELIEGRYSGPYIGCRARSKVFKIAIDITCSRGLATYNSTTGEPENATVGWRVEYRAVDDFGSGSTADSPGDWTVLQEESLTLAQAEPVRRTYEYELTSTCRPQVRLTRTTTFDDNSRVANTIEWAGMRCFLADPAPLCATATHIEIQMRGSAQLSGLTQRRFAVISRRKLRTWAPGVGWSATTQETRSGPWAIADKWTSTVYGDGYADDRCDLQGLYDLAQLVETRQDRFDGVFDQTSDSQQADQMIAQSFRSSAIRRNGVMTVVRDQQRSLPVTAFTSRNIAPGSLRIKYKMATEETPDGVIVEFWNNRIWDWDDSIVIPVPGVTAPTKPQRLRLFGITGAKHAEREGIYNVYDDFYRRKICLYDTELEGMIPGFGSAVAFTPSLPGWGRGGDVVSYDVATRLLVASEPFTWTTGSTHYLSIIDADGSLSTPYVVTKGPNDYSAYLPATMTEVLSSDSSDRERTRYCFGVGTPYPSVLRVLSTQNSGDETGVRKFTITGLVENNLVHTADNALLPAEGEIQDPVDASDDPDGGGGDVALTVNLENFYSSEFVLVSKIEFNADGFVYRWEQDTSGTLINRTRVPNSWLRGTGPFAPGDVSQFEVRLTPITVDPLGSAVNSWLSLGTTREWYVQATGMFEHATSVVNIEIRRVSTGIVQDTYEFLGLEAFGPGGPDGGS
jgi:hypothetical protein